jgi:hypothetical protein
VPTTRHRAVLTALIALTAVLLAACSELTPTEIRQLEGDRISLRPLLDPDAVAVPGTDTADVIAALGEPEQSEESTPPDDQQPGTQTTMRYDGLEIVVRELRKPKRAFISTMTITSREYAITVPVAVGSRRKDVEAVFGEPSESEGAEAAYDLTSDGDRCVVTYDGDRASRLAFTFN